VYPRRPGGPPRYETFEHRPFDKEDRFLLALSPGRRDGSAMIGQDAFFSVAALRPGFSGRYAMHGTGTGVYVHCAAGSVEVGGQRLGPGDAVGIWETEGCDVAAITQSELVLVEVPMARGVST
jgi:quercetin 2,3-dioxygenase